MNLRDKSLIIERYENRQRNLGVGPAALGEPKRRQAFYYHFLLDTPLLTPEDDILDLGCGYGDLYPWLLRRGWKGRYTGIDIVPALVEAGRERYPGADLRTHDIQEAPLESQWDWIVSVGALSAAMTDIDSYEHVETILRAAWPHTVKGLSFNLFSPFCDYANPLHFHPDLGRLSAIIAKLTRRFVIRHDYMPYDCAFFLFKDDTIDRELSIFSRHRPLFETLRASDES